MNYMPINEKHAEEIAELELELFDNCFNEHTIRKEIEAGWGFVAMDDDGLAGYALVRDDAGVSDLTRLGVAKRRQGKGIGKALLEAVELKAPDLMLCVRKDNGVAINLYMSRGFKIVGVVGDSWVLRKTLENKG